MGLEGDQMTTYHVKYRFGFVRCGGMDMSDLVLDCRDADIFSRIGAISVANQINARIGEFDEKAVPVMLTSSGKVRRVRS